MATHNLGRVAYADKGAYNSSTTYINKDVVQYNNGSYVLQADTATGIVPTNTSYWTPMQNPTALNQATASANTAAQSANTAANSAVKAAETANTVMNNTASPIRKSATGKVIALNNAADKPLRGLKLYGRTTQATTNGKNLINTIGASGGTSAGITVTVNADGSYTINGTATDINVNVWFKGYFDANAPTLFVLPAGTYYVAGIALYSGVRLVSGNYQIAGSFFTLAEDTPITGLRCTFVTSGQTYTNRTVYPIVAAGSEAVEWEPYTGGIPSPNPDYPQELVNAGNGGSVGVKSHGKNLLNYDAWKTVLIQRGTAVWENNGVTLTATADDCYTGDGLGWEENGVEFPAKIFVTPGETILLSWEADRSYSAPVYLFPNARVEGLISCNNTDNRPLVYTVPEGVAYVTIRFTALKAGDVISYRNIMVERGSQRTAFEPYKDGGTLTVSTPNGLPGLPVTSGGNYTDTDGQQWLCDEIDFERGVYVQNLYTFKAFEKSVTQTGFTLYEAMCPYALRPYYIGASATHVPQSSYTYNNEFNVAHYWVHNDRCRVWLPEGASAEGLTVIGVLASPIETPLSADELASYRAMSTFDPYTVVYSDSDVEMIVDYIGETEKFVHKVIDDRAAPPIIETASGSVVSVNDSAHRPLQGLRLYGKTTQDGTPTPDAPVPLVNVGAGGSIGVKAQGKNLLDVSCVPASQTLHGVTLVNNGDGTLTFSGTAVNNSAWEFALNTPIPAGVYTLSANNEKAAQSGSLNLYFSDSDGTDTPVAQMSVGANATRVFTANRPIARMKVYFTAGVVTNGVTIRPQLEIGSTATAYEQYADGGSVSVTTPNGLPGIPVSSGSNYTDSTGQQWLCDEIDLARGVYIQRVGRILIDSTNTSLSLQNSGGLCQAFASPSPYVPGYAVDPSPYMMCDTLPPVPRKNAAEQAINGASLTGDHILLRVAGVTTIAGMREWLAANPTTVLYQPAQPIAIETPLSASELAAYRAMTSQYPNTTVYNDAGAGMAVDYIADTKAYIDKQLAAIAATLIEQ